VANEEWMRLALLAYEAGSEPALWPKFLESYARLISADISLIQVHHFDEHRSNILATFGLKTVFQDSYNRYYSRINVWREGGKSHYKENEVFLDPEMYPRRLLQKTEFYNDCLIPFGGIHSMAGVVTRTKDTALALTGLRDVHREGWEVSDKQLVKFLLPHVRRACSIQQKLWILKAGEMVLDGLPSGMVLFNDSGRAIYANRAAEAIFRENDGLLLKGGVLVSRSAAQTYQIERSVRSAATAGVAHLGPEVLLVERTSLRRPYQIVLLPIRRRFPQFNGIGAPVVLGMITDPERQVLAPTELIQKVYGLTPKEAELAEKLSNGMGPEEAADQLGMQYETARTHLKHIYGKMGISRQSELAALLGRFPRVHLD
jgi:DNA-binding CsgD family transcriptional regulator